MSVWPRSGFHEGWAAARRAAVFRLFCILALALISGCDDGSSKQMVADLEAREAENDPPTMWSIEVVNETSGGRPVFICANRRIVSGFSSIVPGDGIVNCARDVDITENRKRSQFRCELKGVTYAVSSAVVGDMTKDFSVSSSAHPLMDGGTDYARTLRFRRRGACPAGWKLGEATNQRGVRTLAY